MIERVFDEDTEIIRVTVSGSWDSAEIDDHYTKLQMLIATLRGRSIPIRILVDIRNAPKRSSAIEAQIASNKDSTYRPGDRVAILTSNAADKEHVRALFDGISKWGWESELAPNSGCFSPATRPNLPNSQINFSSYCADHRQTAAEGMAGIEI